MGRMVDAFCPFYFKTLTKDALMTEPVVPDPALDTAFPPLVSTWLVALGGQRWLRPSAGMFICCVFQ